jgi:hypothetical protein
MPGGELCRAELDLISISICLQAPWFAGWPNLNRHSLGPPKRANLGRGRHFGRRSQEHGFAGDVAPNQHCLPSAHMICFGE